MTTYRTKEEVKSEIIASSCFILAALIVIPTMLPFMPEGRFPPGSTTHHWYRIFWWTCMALNFGFLVRAKAFSDSIFGSILVIATGPVTTLTIGFRRLYPRLFPTR